MVKKDRRKYKRSKQSSLNKQNSAVKSNYSEKQLCSEGRDQSQHNEEKYYLNQFNSPLKELETQQIAKINLQTQKNIQQGKTENQQKEVKSSSINQQVIQNFCLTDKMQEETDENVQNKKNIVKQIQVKNVEGQDIEKQIKERNEYEHQHQHGVDPQSSEPATEQIQTPCQDSQSREHQHQHGVEPQSSEPATEQIKTPCQDSQSREHLQVFPFQANYPVQVAQLSEQYPQVRTDSDKIQSLKQNIQPSSLGIQIPTDHFTLLQSSHQLPDNLPFNDLEQQQSIQQTPISQSNQFQLFKNIEQMQLPKMMEMGSSEVVHCVFHNKSEYYQNSVQQLISREERLILQANELISPKKELNQPQQDNTQSNPLQEVQLSMPQTNNNNNQITEQTKLFAQVYKNDQLIIDLSIPIDIPSPKKAENQLQILQQMEPYTLQQLQPYTLQSHTIQAQSQSKMQRIKMFFERNSKIVQEIQFDSQDQQILNKLNSHQYQLPKLGGDSHYSSRQGSDLCEPVGDERELLQSCKESIIQRLREQIDYDNNIEQQQNVHESPATSSPVLFKVRAVKQQQQLQQESNWQQYQLIQQSPPISQQSLSQQSFPTLLFRNMLNPLHRTDDDMHDPTNSPIEHFVHRPPVHQAQQQQCTVDNDDDNNKHYTIVQNQQQHPPIYIQNSIMNLALISSATLQNEQPTYNDYRMSSQQCHDVQQIRLFRNEQHANSSQLEPSESQQQSISQSSQLKQSIDFRLQLQLAYQSKHRHQYSTNNPTYAPSLYQSVPIYGKYQQIDQLKDQKSLQYIPIPSQIVTKTDLQKDTKQSLNKDDIEDNIITTQLDDNHQYQQALTTIDASQDVVAANTSSPQSYRQKQHVVQSVVKRWESHDNNNEFVQSSQFTYQNDQCNKQDSSPQFQMIKQSIQEGFFRVNVFQNMSPQSQTFYNNRQQEQCCQSGRDTIIDVLTDQMTQSNQYNIPQQQVSQFQSQQQQYHHYNHQDHTEDDNYYKTQQQQQQQQIQQSRHVHFGQIAPILHNYSHEQYMESENMGVSKPSERYRQFMADNSAHNQVQQSRITIGDHVDFSHEESNIRYTSGSHVRYTGGSNIRYTGAYGFNQCQSFFVDNIYDQNYQLQTTQKARNLTQEMEVQQQSLTQQSKEQMLILNIEFHSEEVIQPETQEIIWKALDETQLPPYDAKPSPFQKKYQPIQYPSLSQYPSSQQQECSPYFKPSLVVEKKATQPKKAQSISQNTLIPQSPPEEYIPSLAGQVQRAQQPRVVSLDEFKKKYQVRTITLAQHKNYIKNADGFISLKPTQSKFIHHKEDIPSQYNPIKNTSQMNTIKTTSHLNIQQHVSTPSEITQSKKPQNIQQSRIDISIDQTAINHQQYSNTLPQLEDSTEVIEQSHATLSLSQSTQQIVGQNKEEQRGQQPTMSFIIVKLSQPLTSQTIGEAFHSSILQQLHNEQYNTIITQHNFSQTPYSSTQSITKQQQHHLLPLTVDTLQKDLPQFQIDMLPINIPFQQIISKQKIVQNQQIHKQSTLVNQNQIADLIFSTSNHQIGQKEKQQIQQKTPVQKNIPQLKALDEEKPLINKIASITQQHKLVQQLPLQNTLSFNISTPFTPTNNSPSYLNQQRNLDFFTSYSTINKHSNPPIPFRDIRLSPTIILPSQKSPIKSEKSSNNIPIEMVSKSKEKSQPKNKVIFGFNRPIQIPQPQGTNDSNHNQPKPKVQQSQSSKQQSIYQVNKASNQYSFNSQPLNPQQVRKYVFNITPKTPQNMIPNLSQKIQKIRSPSQYFESILKPNAQSRYVIQPSPNPKTFYQTGQRTNQSRKKQFDLREQQTFRKYSQIQSKKTPVAFRIELQNSKSKEKSFSNNQTILHQNVDTTSRQNKQKKQKICLTLRRDYLDKTHTINQSKEKSSTKNQNEQLERRNTSTSQCRKLNGGSTKKKTSFETDGNQIKEVKKIKQVRINRDQKRIGITEPIQQNQYEEKKFQKIEKFNPGEVRVNNENNMNKTKQQRSNSSKGFNLINNNPASRPQQMTKVFSLSQNFGKEQTKIKPNKVEQPSDKDNRKSPSLRVIGKKSQQPINLQQQTQSNQPFWEQFKGIIKNRLIGNPSPKTNSQQRRTQYQNYEKDQLSDVENEDVIFRN